MAAAPAAVARPPHPATGHQATTGGGAATSGAGAAGLRPTARGGRRRRRRTAGARRRAMTAAVTGPDRPSARGVGTPARLGGAMTSSGRPGRRAGAAMCCPRRRHCRRRMPPLTATVTAAVTPCRPRPVGHRVVGVGVGGVGGVGRPRQGELFKDGARFWRDACRSPLQPRSHSPHLISLSHRHSRGAADDISDDDIRDQAGGDFVE